MGSGRAGDKAGGHAGNSAGDHYATMQQGFRWRVPKRFNMAEACSRRWAARPDAAARVAIIEHQGEGAPRTHSYAALQTAANCLSNALLRLGVRRGDRVAIVMPQRFETAVAYMGVLQMGAIAMPLSQLFGPDALEYRLQNAEALAAICDEASMDSLLATRASCPSLRTVIGLGIGAGRADHAWHAVLAQSPDTFELVDTRADDPAVLIYTSGTTGAPKGALIPHRALIGNLPGFVCSHNWFGFEPSIQSAGASPQSDSRPRAGAGRGGGGHMTGKAQSAGKDRNTSVFWSPADWAWTGGLMDALLPSLYFGRPIVAHNGRFDPELAFQILDRHRVTHSFLFPTALKAMMKAVPYPRQHYKLYLQGLMSAGEAVGDAVFAWCRDELGVIVNEMFGQTEVNYIVGNCAMNDQRASAAAPGRPKQGGAPSGGSEAHEVASVGALSAAAPGRPKQGGAPLGGSEAHEVASVGACLVGWPAKPNSMGRGYPGHLVDVIDEEGRRCADGVPGEVAIRRTDIHGDPDPIFFLGYWNNEAATRAKFTGDWWRTGDVAVRDQDGYLWYQGRADDVFKSAGYRIGPGEIENCLVKHPAVANCAVVPKPDAERGALVKAYVVLTPDYAARRDAAGTFEQALIAQLQQHVRGQLAPYEYPKEIEFIDQLPMTTTGKVQRRVLRLQEEERARAAAGAR
ncbi:AMP-binding protein [Ottowia sp.]|uniref:acyl-CoA synthetase n=1 Tax=Ottowia sp. TaxID=1898956 RepID=UPI002B8FBCB9|nr:AMP-binding protein [Ottowia sp.]HRN76290.1 AMP-binding protein [Ottowia sp.]HRQ03569.1 AMP-binding protein [Ottowia sp.]